jgi:DNA-binding response OmpR family regulator
MTTILLLDIDTAVCETLRGKLEREGYCTLIAHDGLRGLELARMARPDLIILETQLPQLDGFAVCRIIRFESDVPILMLTAIQDESDRVRGLDLGADDYVIKPFLPDELLARVRALLRRSARPLRHAQRGLLSVENLLLDTSNRRVFRGGQELRLAQKEFDLLACLMHNRGVALTREVLLEHVWGVDFKTDARTVDVHIRWLRAKIEADPAHPRYICTVRGLGYRFAETADELRAEQGLRAAR